MGVCVFLCVGVCVFLCVGVCGKMCAFVGEISSIYTHYSLSLSLPSSLPESLTLSLPHSLCMYILFCIVQLQLCWVGIPTLYTLQFICQASSIIFLPYFIQLLIFILKCSNLNFKNLLKHILFNVIKMYYLYPTLSKCIYYVLNMCYTTVFFNWWLISNFNNLYNTCFNSIQWKNSVFFKYHNCSIIYVCPFVTLPFV